MKGLFLLLILTSFIFSNELILISNDTKEIEQLYAKYTQDLLVDNNRTYLIPKTCKLERYFGGSSQGHIELVQEPVHTDEIIITQEVFEAKDSREIQKRIDLDKSISLIQGKEAKEFLADDEGRAFGGASEKAIDFSFQKTELKQAKNTLSSEVFEEDEVPSSPPLCELLEDGSGYRLIHTKDARFYNNRGFYQISSNEILFD